MNGDLRRVRRRAREPMQTGTEERMVSAGRVPREGPMEMRRIRMEEEEEAAMKMTIIGSLNQKAMQKEDTPMVLQRLCLGTSHHGVLPVLCR